MLHTCLRWGILSACDSRGLWTGGARSSKARVKRREGQTLLGFRDLDIFDHTVSLRQLTQANLFGSAGELLCDP